MTERYKAEQQASHTTGILREALDSLDWDASVAFMAAFLDRIGPHLPAELRSQPPQRFARHYEEIVKAYVRSLDSVRQVLRAL